MDKEILFEALNRELFRENVSLEIICVGGFVLEYYNLRGTQDIDAFYREIWKSRMLSKELAMSLG